MRLSAIVDKRKMSAVTLRRLKVEYLSKGITGGCSVMVVNRVTAVSLQEDSLGLMESV